MNKEKDGGIKTAAGLIRAVYRVIRKAAGAVVRVQTEILNVKSRSSALVQQWVGLYLCS